MANAFRVHASFWSSETIKSLDSDSRTLAIYLLTCSQSNLIGVFRLPFLYASADLSFDNRRLEASFKKLSVAGFAKRCLKTGFVYICNFLKFNPLQNPNQFKNAVSLFKKIPDDCFLKREFFDAWGKYINKKPAILEKLSTGQKLTKRFLKGLDKSKIPQYIEVKKEKSSISCVSQSYPHNVKKNDTYIYNNYINKECSKFSESFEIFWNSYPEERRFGKQKNFRIWRKMQLDQSLETILQSLKNWMSSIDWIMDDGKYICSPSKFLSERRFELKTTETANFEGIDHETIGRSRVDAKIEFKGLMEAVERGNSSEHDMSSRGMHALAAIGGLSVLKMSKPWQLRHLKADFTAKYMFIN